MLILTTVYLLELRDLTSEPESEDTLTLERSAAKSYPLLRQFLSLYEGRGRVLPFDRHR